MRSCALADRPVETRDLVHPVLDRVGKRLQESPQLAGVRDQLFELRSGEAIPQLLQPQPRIRDLDPGVEDAGASAAVVAGVIRLRPHAD